MGPSVENTVARRPPIQTESRWPQEMCLRSSNVDTLRMNTTNHGPKTFIILTDDFPPSTGGGIATWAAELSEGLVKRGHTVMVLTRRKRTSDRARYTHSAKVMEAGGPDWNRYRWLYMTLRVIPLLLATKRPVIVASTWQHVSAIVFLKRWFDFLLVCFAHAQDITKSVGTGDEKNLKRVLQRSDVCIAVSRYLERFMRESLPGVVFESGVIHNGVDVETFRPLGDKAVLRKKFHIDEDARVILTIGRTIEMKGFRQVIRVLPAVLSKFPKTSYLIAGLQKEPEYGKIKAMVSELQLERHVRFLSVISHERLPELYNACDVFVLAARPVFTPQLQQDNFPLVLLEASACELPVIGTDCAGVPEAIADGNTGFVVHYDDLPALTEKIMLLLENAELRKKLGQEGRRFIERHFTRQMVADKLLSRVQQIDERRAQSHGNHLDAA